MDEVTLFFSILIAGFSLLLLIVSIAAYNRLRAIKILIISIAFLAFAVKGILVIIEIITQDTIALCVDFVILVLLYFAVVKR